MLMRLFCFEPRTARFKLRLSSGSIANRTHAAQAYAISRKSQKNRVDIYKELLKAPDCPIITDRVELTCRLVL